MFKSQEYDAITQLLIENIEILEFTKSLNDEFLKNFNDLEDLILEKSILKEEKIIIIKLKMIFEISTNDPESLNVIKNILANLFEINEFKKLVNDSYGLGKGGYWSFTMLSS